MEEDVQSGILVCALENTLGIQTSSVKSAISKCAFEGAPKSKGAPKSSCIESDGEMIERKEWLKVNSPKIFQSGPGDSVDAD